MMKLISLVSLIGIVYMYHAGLANQGITQSPKAKIATKAMCFVSGICIALM